MALGSPDSVRLVHLGRPVGMKAATPKDHGTLGSTVGATIAGVAPDDSAVILATGDPSSGTAALVRVDPIDRGLRPPREREWPVVLRGLGRPTVGTTIAGP